ncbi:hypothetical protein D187_001563 [Cystobacter fuscus DSM 2262]|uniref:Uncharacterized protein n=1 Tax=Cystobacter fuscus (strain ATCC 25194 / DSM 2262 / NBRC 100088 / M29) TaxID=1242864 RepID=S9PCT3_CYSF2|nr:hypothetical protein D187_001563 [Cystobacter fuscus DSM 2262]
MNSTPQGAGEWQGNGNEARGECVHGWVRLLHGPPTSANAAYCRMACPLTRLVCYQLVLA